MVTAERRAEKLMKVTVASSGIALRIYSVLLQGDD